jgi:hypothetical protein
MGCGVRRLQLSHMSPNVPCLPYVFRSASAPAFVTTMVVHTVLILCAATVAYMTNPRNTGRTTRRKFLDFFGSLLRAAKTVPHVSGARLVVLGV